MHKFQCQRLHPADGYTSKLFFLLKMPLMWNVGGNGRKKSQFIFKLTMTLGTILLNCSSYTHDLKEFIEYTCHTHITPGRAAPMERTIITTLSISLHLPSFFYCHSVRQKGKSFLSRVCTLCSPHTSFCHGFDTVISLHVFT